MPTYTIKTDDVLAGVARDLANAPKTMQTYLTKSLPKQIERDIQPLKTEPRQPDYPFIWSFDPAKQARARAWYFANRVKGNTGGRYQRTHGLVKGWIVTTEAVGTSALISISNPAERAVKWVQSVFAVPSHQRSGWAEYEGVVLKAEERAINSIIDTWFLIVSGGKFA